MEFLSEDPTYVAGALGILGCVFLMVLRTSQQGKYLVWALGSWGLAVLVIGIEWVWVTDNERIEQVVYDLRRAAQATDADGVLKHLASDVEYVPGKRLKDSPPPILRRVNLVTGAATRAFVKSELQQCSFDYIRMTKLETHAGAQSRRGTAEFRVFVSGSYRGMAGTSASDWSLGLRETSPKVWQVDRISPVHLPTDMVLMSPAVSSGVASGGGEGLRDKLPLKIPGG